MDKFDGKDLSKYRVNGSLKRIRGVFWLFRATWKFKATSKERCSIVRLIFKLISPRCKVKIITEIANKYSSDASSDNRRVSISVRVLLFSLLFVPNKIIRTRIGQHATRLFSHDDNVEHRSRLTAGSRNYFFPASVYSFPWERSQKMGLQGNVLIQRCYEFHIYPEGACVLDNSSLGHVTRATPPWMHRRARYV